MANNNKNSNKLNNKGNNSGNNKGNNYKSNNSGNNNANNSSDDSGFNNILTMSIVIIVGLFVIYYLYTSYVGLTTEKKTDPRPYPKCPTYWDSVEGGKCRNVHKIGKCRTGKSPDDLMDFSSDIFGDKKTGNYMKCKWAKECHAPWEGIDELCD
jgi:preprotein translocase subunit SecG